MTHEQFIEAIGAAVQRLAPEYGIKVCSPVIGQAILESAWGASNKVLFKNYFGLKYRPGRLTCHSGTFTDGSSEQLKDGSYIPITDQWYAFESLEKGVEGYFQFINTPNYNALKGITDPYEYLTEIKKAGYATSRNYVQNVWKVIQDNDLQRFDKGEETMANSKLASYNANCMNRNPRRMKIDRITPHYMAGNMGAVQCANYFGASGRQASCNYCIGSDGAIAVCVPEDYRAWTSSSEANDTRAVTFECANIDANGTLTDACYNSLIALCADICTRHGINPHYDGTTNGSITMHCMFAATSCPGNWLKTKITSGQFERDIKAKMGQPTYSAPTTSEMYRVRKTWADAKSQTGAYRSLDNAKKACGKGYTVYDSKGKAVYTNGAAASGSAKKSNAEIAKEVMAGKWGNGQDRKNRLTAAGYSYDAVQAEVNKLASGGSVGKSVSQLADEVIAGKWGNGQDRINRLRAAGYDPATVQAEVNRRYS